MQDINGLIKEYDNDNLLLDTLKHFINDLTKIMGNEIPEDALDEFVTNNTEGFGMAFNFLNNALGYIAQGGGSSGSGGVSFDSLNISLTKPSNIGSLGLDTWEINRIIQSETYKTYYLLTDCLIRGKFSNATLDSEGKIEVASHSKYMVGTLPCIYQMSNDGYKSHNGALEFMGSSSGTSTYFSPDGDLPSGNITFYIRINGVVEGDLSYEQ